MIAKWTENCSHKLYFFYKTLKTKKQHSVHSWPVVIVREERVAQSVDRSRWNCHINVTGLVNQPTNGPTKWCIIYIKTIINKIHKIIPIALRPYWFIVYQCTWPNSKITNNSLRHCTINEDIITLLYLAANTQYMYIIIIYIKEMCKLFRLVKKLVLHFLKKNERQKVNHASQGLSYIADNSQNGFDILLNRGK